MINRWKLNTDLEEELRDLGCDVSGKGLASIAARRLDEDAMGGQAMGAIGSLGSPSPGSYEDPEDPIDGDWVTHELLDRLESLEVDNWHEAEECPASLILAGLAQKNVDADDTELQERAEKIVRALMEARQAFLVGRRVA